MTRDPNPSNWEKVTRTEKYESRRENVLEEICEAEEALEELLQELDELEILIAVERGEIDASS